MYAISQNVSQKHIFILKKGDNAKLYITEQAYE